MGFEVLLGLQVGCVDSEPSHLRWGLQGVPETAPESFPFAGSDAEIWATSPSWKMIFGFRLPLGFSGDSEWHKSDQTRLE